MGMQKISQLLQVAIMEKKYVLGMQHSKIGAKTTMNFQPIDVGHIFKCIKSKTRSTYAQETDFLLIKLTISELYKLQSEDRLILEK